MADEKGVFMKEIYDPSITNPSLEELKEFALWYNEKIGNYPVIVGGWAVYFYTKGLGSKDIDVIFAGAAAKNATLLDYFHSHGFKTRHQSLFDYEFYKQIDVKGQMIEIIIDAASQERVITFDGRRARLPWSLAFKHSVKHEVGKATIYIPELELLIVYKLGAILGRNDYIRAGNRVAHYQAKIWKDVYDVLSLCSLDVDARKVRSFMKTSGLGEFSADILRIMEANFNDETKDMMQGESITRVRKILGLSEFRA